MIRGTIRRRIKILPLMSLALAAFAVTTWMIAHAQGSAQVEPIAALEYPLFEPGEGPEPDPRRHLYLMTGHLAIYFGYEQGRLPSSLEELRPYLFFLPVPHFTKWELSKDGDLLLIEAIVSETVDPKMYRKGIHLPGSSLWMESKLAARRHIAAVWRNNPTNHPGWVREEDIVSGKYSASPFDMMQSYARNEKEFLQLYRSWILGHLLLPALEGYHLGYDVYPERLEDAFAALGELNEEAWVSVMTGEPLEIGDRRDGTCIFYERTEDGQGYELLIPLYGAGTEKPIGVNKSEFYEKKYIGGKYFRFTDKMTYSYGL